MTIQKVILEEKKSLYQLGYTDYLTVGSVYLIVPVVEELFYEEFTVFFTPILFFCSFPERSFWTYHRYHVGAEDFPSDFSYFGMAKAEVDLGLQLWYTWNISPLCSEYESVSASSCSIPGTSLHYVANMSLFLPEARQ